MKRPHRLTAAWGLLWLALTLALTAACGRHTAPADRSTDTLPFDEATLLHVERGRGYVLAEVADPWHTGRTLRRYVLVPRDSTLPPHLPEGTLLRTPLRRVASLSVVHAGLFFDLGRSDALAAVTDLNYTLHPLIRKAVAEGRTADAGSSMKPDAERLAAARPDAIFVSPFENAGYGALEQMGVPLVECADYMETTALGRAEWMRFYGMLLGCAKRADSLYDAVARRYRTLARRAEGAEPKPTLLVDRKEGAVWFVPAGGSTMGGLFADAGARYLFADMPGSGSLQLSFETVFARGRDADIWLLKYGAVADPTYASLAADYGPYRRFRPWQQRRIYGCNTLRVPFYEEAPFHPDRLLADLICIFHPERMPGHRLRYYQPLK